MNKKIISYLLCISILFTVFFIVSEKQVYADNSNVMTLEEAIKLINDRVNSKKKTKFSTINEPYVYPILPGTKEWESFKSKDEMMDACQIPSEIVDSMSTEALTLSVINHPLLDTEVLSYNDYTQGFDSFVSDFDAAKALLEREDFAVNLAKIYLDTPVLNKEEYKEQRSNSQNTMLDFTVKETVLAVPQVFNLFKEDEAEALIVIAENKMKEKSENQEMYGTSVNTFFTVRATVSGKNNRNGFATVLTPRGSSVVVITISDAEFTTQQKEQINATYRKEYPQATIVASASKKYNCHSYAWYLSSTSNRYWMDDPSKYMSDGSYWKLNYSNVKSGAKMYWSEKQHSANVISVNSSAANGKKCTVQSKWGQGPIMKHNESYSPYNNSRTVWGR